MTVADLRALAWKRQLRVRDKLQMQTWCTVANREVAAATGLVRTRRARRWASKRARQRAFIFLFF